MRKEVDRWEPYPPKHEISRVKWDRGYLDLKNQFRQRIQPQNVPEAVRELGMKLRDVRLAQGMTIDDVAKETYIPKKYLEAIEQGDLRRVPSGIYVRNYIKLYAKVLSFDQTQVRTAFAATDSVIDTFLPHVGSQAREASFARSKKDSRLPRLGEFLLYFFLSQAERINVVGDLEEEYDSIAAKFGERAARLYFYKQISVSLSPFITKFVLRILFEIFAMLLNSRRW